ncbi:pyridoxamine 5'-phosphate oxidase family protein [Sanguibacter sp. HDW7]|uniref:pyridoxamine 5'-phosphate oxidase family protein n=1 Tax=Sanguibacter sp. HDW7 TaxID=2714931 RepID=UPI00140C6EE2|nr:TIGR03618 family F420-dependent PPOX class oxidoreductase [Sanguibacter sp. HDW7]QIK83323.1 TIGR03618 family F420-dependent PPOX class oxidoreductase [Sanguibacter sp. HDW7]
MRPLTPEQTVFVTERHLATLTTLRADGTPHVVPVAFTWDADAQLVRITTERTSVKARNIAAAEAAGVARVAVCQVDGGRWLTFEGTATVSDDAADVAEAVRRYAVRYRSLDPNPSRVVLVVRPDRVLGSGYMTH